ncbi:MAG: OmpL47-type beta-barrel domain-containing protein, partial [Actinomycetota bacterium]
AACASPVTFGGLADGSHTVFVRVTDNASNQTTIQNTFTVDRTDPTVSITSGPDPLTNSTSATFQFTSSDASGTTEACQLDGGGFASCASPASYAALADGSHTFDVRATDGAGNAATASFTWTVDTAGPDTTITVKPADPTGSATATFEFTSGDAGATFECSLDAAAFAACSSPATYPGLADGTHDFEVRAVDAAANPDPTPAAASWLVDTTPPTTTYTLTPSDPSNDSTPDFEFTGDDGAGSGVDRFECANHTDATFTTCVSPYSFSAPDSTPSALMKLRACDAVGNCSASNDFAWGIDLEAPETTITSAPADPTPDDSPTFEFTGTDAVAGAGNPTGIIEFECSLTAPGYSSVTTCTSPDSYSGLLDETYTYAVRARDAAGNWGPASSTSFTLDTGAPDTTITLAPADPESNASPIFEFTSTESGSTFECSVDGAAFAACSSGDAFGPLADGPHAFEVRAIDPAGNTDATPASHAWTVDTTAPAVTLDSTPADPTNATSASFAFTITDASATTAECVLDATFTDPACASPALYSGPLADGTHTFDLTVTDAAGNATAVPFSWLVDTVAPEMVTPFGGPPAYTNSTDADITFTATDSGSGVASYECRLMPGPFEPCTSPYQLTGLADGAHQVRVRATDAAGNTGLARRHDWTVDTVVPSTTLISTPKHFCCEPGTTATFEFSVDGTGSPVADTECSVDGGAFASCSSPFVVTGVSEGVHEFQIRSTDAAGNVEPTIVYQWTQGDPPETFLDSAPTTPSASSDATFEFSSDRDPAGFRCLLQRIGGPQAYFQTCSNPKTYSGLTDGSYRFEVRAFDSLNNPDPTPAFYDFVIDLSAPTVTLDPVTSPTASSDVTLSFSADDPDATFACSLDGGASEACTSPKTYSGLSDGSHTFEVTASDALGNTSAPASATVLVDTTPPTATITSGPDASTSSTSATFTFTGSDSGSGVAGFECSLDAAAFAACTSPHTENGLSDGSHTLQVRAVDQV